MTTFDAGIEAAARWHDQRARDTPDAFEMELHQVSAKAIRSLASAPGERTFAAVASINEDAGTTDVVFEDTGYVAKPLIPNVYHWIDLHHAMDDDHIVGVTIWATKPPAPGERGSIVAWRPMSEARKDGKPVLLLVKSDVRLDRDDLECWRGIQFVGRHPGLAEDGFDIGWSVAAPVGHGGFPDDWFIGWQPLPAIERADHLRTPGEGG